MGTAGGREVGGVTGHERASRPWHAAARGARGGGAGRGGRVGWYTANVTPPIEVILRRRHLARTGVRVVVVLCVVKALWMLSDALTGDVFSGWPGGGRGVIGPAFENWLGIGVWLVTALALLLLERRLSRWLVPMPTPDHVCHQCGYSLKNLKSPVCPECGVDLSPRGRIPPMGR